LNLNHSMEMEKIYAHLCLYVFGVTGIENHTIKSKVAIETEDGTLQANGVWTSGLCDNNFELENSSVEFQAIVKDYKFSHFGEEYNYMCMDTVAWKIAYQRNNELLK